MFFFYYYNKVHTKEEFLELVGGGSVVAGQVWQGARENTVHCSLISMGKKLTKVDFHALAFRFPAAQYVNQTFHWAQIYTVKAFFKKIFILLL